MRAEARRWIEQGRAELAMARSLVASSGFSGAAFHSHQAAEMTMKGVYRARALELIALAEEVERWVSAASA